ncbi:MAG: hypothetical protein ACPG7F_10430, partial [Aggregatilineales bacterium]
MNEQNTTRPALIRLLIVFVIFIGFVIYSYGWTVTDVDLDKPQEAQRQENVGNALRELLSPRMFSQEREIIEISASFLMECGSSDETLPDSVVHESGGTVTISPTCGEAGDVIDVQVENFAALADTRIRWIPPEGESRPREDLISEREEIVLDNNGSFTGQIEVPRIRRTEGQIHRVEIRSALPSGPIVLSDISQLTILRMIETIFMALLATSIAIPIAGFLSFFAARNLMRPVRLTVGRLQIALLTFIIGGAVGMQLLAGLSDLALALGQGEEYGAIVGIIVAILVAVGGFVALRYLNPPVSQKAKDTIVAAMPDTARKLITSLIVTLMIIFILGVIGGLAIQVSSQLQDFGESLRPEFLRELEITREEFYPLNPADWLQNAAADGTQAIGTLLNIIGTFVSLIMPLIIAIITGFSISNVFSGLLAAPLRNLSTIPGHVIGGILGVLIGGILFA